MEKIFIILFCDSLLASGDIKICETQEEVNKVITVLGPAKIFSYNLKTKKVKAVDWKVKREVTL